MKRINRAVVISPIVDVTAPTTEQAVVMSEVKPSYTIAPMTAKGLVKVSPIKPAKATLSISQNGQEIFMRTTEGLSLSESYACLCNIFHYQLKGKKVRLDKFNDLTLTLTFGTEVYKATKKAHTNKKGENVPFTSGSVGGLLKVLYHNFAADILEAATMQGTYLNYVHAANTIANFTPVRPGTIIK